MQMIYGEWDFSGLFAKNAVFGRMPETRPTYIDPEVLPQYELGFAAFTGEPLIYQYSLVEKNGRLKVKMLEREFNLMFVGYIQSVWSGSVHWSTKYLKQIVEPG